MFDTCHMNQHLMFRDQTKGEGRRKKTWNWNLCSEERQKTWEYASFFKKGSNDESNFNCNMKSKIVLTILCKNYLDEYLNILLKLAFKFCIVIIAFLWPMDFFARRMKYAFKPYLILYHSRFFFNSLDLKKNS